MNKQYVRITEADLPFKQGDECLLFGVEWSEMKEELINSLNDSLNEISSNGVAGHYRRPIALSASQFDDTTAENEFSEANEAAIKTLVHLGYTYHGAELWKPPIGKPKSEPVEWDGEGLPPVGTKCEARWLEMPDGGTPEWVKGRFKGGYDSKIWFGTESFVEIVLPAHSIEFRPLQTPEQKAEIERQTVTSEYQSSTKRIERFHMVEDHQKLGAFYDWLKETGRLTKGDE